MRMYDSIHVDQIPADAEEVLAYTDGIYANVDALRQRFPNARLHTISAVGQVPAEWIDCESGCVWPPAAAADKYSSWRTQGCRGLYSALATQPDIRSALTAIGIDPATVAFFDANWNHVDEVDPGDLATQYDSFDGYDVSETSPAFEGVTSTSVPTPTPPPSPKETAMAVVEFANSLHTFSVEPNGTLVHRWQGDGAPSWGSEAVAGGCTYPQSVAVDTAHNGNLNVFADRPDGSQVHAWQPLGGPGWTSEILGAV